MATFADTSKSVSAQHAHTAHNPIAVVKTIPYDETASGVPPKPLISPTQQREMSSPRQVTTRPRTAPAPRRASQFSEDIKRDSGFAGSTKSQLSPALPPTPSLPAFAVAGQGQLAADKHATSKVTPAEEQWKEADEERKPRVSLARRRSRKFLKQKPRSVSPPSFKRLSSFKGLQTDIPTGGLEELNADNFGFSNRGSIFFGGQKMSDWFGSSSSAAEAQACIVPSIIEPKAAIETTGATPDAESPIVSAGTDSLPVATTSKLKTGRRKPSLQMLQAAIAGGRVLSADEINFSMKVRSMYEAGDESGADWSTPSIATGGKDTPDTFTTQTTDEKTPTDQVNELPVRKTRQAAASTPSRRSQDIRASYYTRAEHELAGGIEDWRDINNADVDRYGFIVPRREGDRPGSMAGSAPTEGLHRVATGLRLAADQPRRRGLRRQPSNARSSRSVPPQGSLRPSSLHSGTSAAPSVRSSRRSTFRGRDRRITDAAGDMLTLPPGLADIAEGQDEGQALNMLRRREWSRNEKWQKMARPLRDSSQGTGGGMHFDFDTSDPKVISRTWKGIPDRWRATAWHSFLSASARRRGKHESDQSLIQQFHQLQDTNCADDYQIDVDVPRTISMHVMFRRRYRGGQRLLFRVLHAIALYCPETGYVQGMASLAATLLCYFDEERAFVMLVRLWQLRGLEQLFQPGFNGLMAALKELEDQWLAGSDMARKLNELSIASTSYGTRWYLTLFNMSIPFPAQLRVWDVFMLLGDAIPVTSTNSFGGADLSVLHATSAALIDATREIIIDSDFENGMKVLTSFIPIRDEDLLMRVARAEWKMGRRRRTTTTTTTTTTVTRGTDV